MTKCKVTASTLHLAGQDVKLADVSYPAKGDPEKVRTYMITDKEPPEGYTHTVDLLRCAFQVAKGLPPSGLYRKDADDSTEGIVQTLDTSE